jgi:hypothetical protein
VCTCESAACRGTIRGTDYRGSHMARYNGHVSDYIRSKRTSA